MLGKWKIDEKWPSNHVLGRDESPIAPVLTIRRIVAHRKETVVGNAYFGARREQPHRNIPGTISLLASVGFKRVGSLDRRTIAQETGAFHLQGVARDPDQPLNQILVAIALAQILD